MRLRGAGAIGVQAALALARNAQEFRGSSVESFRSQMLAAATRLSDARPTAVSLRNALNAVLTDTFAAKTLADAKRAAAKAADHFERRAAEAKSKIATAGADMIRPEESLLTHCHSTAALGILLEAHRQGKKPRVFATETRPFRQGLITSGSLHQAGVDVTLIVDSAMLHVMESERIERVLLGADAVSADGSLYNKIGTRLVTLAAKSLGIPVHVGAETYKFSPYSLQGEEIEIEERASTEVVSAKELPGVRIYNPVFDRTPPDQVTAYVTDHGIIEPRNVKKFIEREFGGGRRWI